MSFPVEAFIRIDARDTAAGTFALIQGEWVFRCRFEPEHGPVEQVLWLSGEYAGKVSDVPHEVVLAIDPAYSVKVRISSPERMRPEYQPKPGVIEVTHDGGIEFWASKWGASHHVYAFDFAGKHSSPGERPRPLLTFDAYECWLHKDGEIVGDTPLFTVSPQ